MRIKALTRMDQGPGYYRIRLPLDQLAAFGHDVTVVPAATHHIAGGADVVVGQMIGHDTHPDEITAWWKRLGNTARLVYELDDDVFEVDPASPAYSAYGYAQDSLRQCMRASDMVTTSTAALAEKAATVFDGPIEVLPNYVDETLLNLHRPQRDKLVIGWAGSATHLTDIKECAHGFRKTLERNPNTEGHLIGADFRKVIGPNLPIRHTLWRANTADYYRELDFDIGLAPLAPTVFNRSKSAVKAMEYACLGIPVVASAFVPYEQYVVDGVTGFLITRPEQWAHRLRELVNDNDMRAEMGENAKRAVAHHTIQENWPRWEQAYGKLL